jgi:hypothetical protein
VIFSTFCLHFYFFVVVLRVVFLGHLGYTNIYPTGFWQVTAQERSWDRGSSGGGQTP